MKSKTRPHFTSESDSMKHRTWILVADQSGARIFNRDKKGVLLVEELTHPRGKLKAKDLGTDQPGLGAGKGGTHRHALAPHTDPQEHIADTFAKDLGALLDKGRTADQFNELVLVAGPKFLGKIRLNLTAETAKMVKQSFEKDFAKVPTKEVAGKLEDLLTA